MGGVWEIPLEFAELGKKCGKKTKKGGEGSKDLRGAGIGSGGSRTAQFPKFQHPPRTPGAGSHPKILLVIPKSSFSSQNPLSHPKILLSPLATTK